MRIMCFGDSNTWGYRPDNGLRYDSDERFTGILKQKLPDDEIIEEGLNGRTFVLHDPYCDYASGEAALPYLLKSHMPLDLIVIMLGTNDLKHQFQLSAEAISRGAKVLIRMIKNPYLNEKYPVPKILLVSPIHLHEEIGELEGSWFDYGKEEYEMIKKMKPDLVLTDLEMPKLTGIEVLEKLKEENTEKVPQVIFITGKPSTDFIKRAIKIGALDIVYKPFKDEKIEDVIERNKNAILEENALKTENNSMIEQTSLFKKIMRKIRNNFNSIMNISKEKGF